MQILLDPVEARLLACLIEKSITTPDYYPLTLNALTAACNQKSNRNPEMRLGEEDVVRALDALRDHKLAAMVTLSGSRTPRYRHRMAETLPLSEAQMAVLCELMLRGPQTPGELRTRAGRMATLVDVPAVLAVLRELAGHVDGPLATVLPGRPGQREDRYAHVLCGEPPAEAEIPQSPVEPARRAVMAEQDRLAALEARTAALEEELAGLKARFAEFLHQFE